MADNLSPQCDGSVERHARRDEEEGRRKKEEGPAGDSGMDVRKASIRFEEGLTW